MGSIDEVKFDERIIQEKATQSFTLLAQLTKAIMNDMTDGGVISWETREAAGNAVALLMHCRKVAT